VYDPPYDKPKATNIQGSAKDGSQAPPPDEKPLKEIKCEHLQMLSRCLVSKRKNDTGKHEAEDADEAKMLRGIAAQLKDDAQLRLIWVLHNHLGDEAEAEGTAPAGVLATS